jgi:hypothetical protein
VDQEREQAKSATPAQPDIKPGKAGKMALGNYLIIKKKSGAPHLKEFEPPPRSPLR